jgi:hypothetical protein
LEVRFVLTEVGGALMVVKVSVETAISGVDHLLMPRHPYPTYYNPEEQLPRHRVSTVFAVYSGM